MAKQCAFCGKNFGVFTTGYDIPNSNYYYCDSHLNYKIMLRNALLEDIDANLSPIIHDFDTSLKTKADTFPDAMDAMITSLRGELAADAERQARERAELQKEADRAAEQKRIAEQ